MNGTLQKTKGGGLAKGARGNPRGRGAKIVRSMDGTAQTPTLLELGITKNESSRAQKLAAIPLRIFEDKVGTWEQRALGKRLCSRTAANFHNSETSGRRRLKC